MSIGRLRRSRSGPSERLSRAHSPRWRVGTHACTGCAHTHIYGYWRIALSHPHIRLSPAQLACGTVWWVHPVTVHKVGGRCTATLRPRRVHSPGG
eukprot:1259977-Prymnesium_polylepis.1